MTMFILSGRGPPTNTSLSGNPRRGEASGQRSRRGGRPLRMRRVDADQFREYVVR